MSELRPCDDTRVASSIVTKHAAGVLDANGCIRMPLAAYEPGYGIIKEAGAIGQGVTVVSIGVTEYLAASAHDAGEIVGICDVLGRLGRVPAGTRALAISLKKVTTAGDIGLGFLIHAPMSKEIRGSALAKTAAFTLASVLPEAGTYLVKQIVIVETAGNAVTGGIKIGTTSGGAEVVTAQAVGASGQVNATLAKSVFVLAAAQTFYVDAVSAWNSANINLYVVAEKLS